MRWAPVAVAYGTAAGRASWNPGAAVVGRFVAWRTCETASQKLCIGMLIIALDYDYAPSSELTCTKDARTMYRMAGRAGVDDVTIITDKALGDLL